jgi:alginate O-acetyltransferase complex protein AlgI
VWGVYFGILLTLEKFFYLNKLEKHNILSRIYAMFFVCISFMIFAAPTMKDALNYVAGMFNVSQLPLLSKEFIYNLKNYGFVILIAIIGATPLMKNLKQKIDKKTNDALWVYVLELITLILLVIISTSYLADGSFNPFLYFRF